MQGTGEFKRQTSRAGWFCRVTVTLTGKPGSGVVAGEGLESIPSTWWSGLAQGAAAALEVSGEPEQFVQIDSFVGVMVDTNPTLCAVAAARAVLTALGRAPSPAWHAHLVALAMASWDAGYSVVPDVATLRGGVA